jgi:hypothetical protein
MSFLASVLNRETSSVNKRALLPLAVIFTLAGCHSTVRDSSPRLLKDGVQLGQNTVATDDPGRRMEVLGSARS